MLVGRLRPLCAVLGLTALPSTEWESGGIYSGSATQERRLGTGADLPGFEEPRLVDIGPTHTYNPGSAGKPRPARGLQYVS